VPGVIVIASDATNAMMSMTATLSMSVKPALRSLLHVRDVGRGARAALAAI
jgi:hypothetical protein